ncbi:MAG: hypothetical protein LBB46_01455, partial [Coriobacteriaceae bacterium]|nr:hypothetical protein [Coriobacteriaceae bacterium]
EEAGTDGQRDSDDATGGTDAAEEKVYATDFPVDEDGFLIPAPERAGLWQTSEQGRAYLAGIDYQKRFDELLSADPPLSGIYYLILELCSDEPQSIDELDAQLKAPLAAVGSKKHAGFFVELLEGYDALKWEKKWKTTTVGRELLAARKEE